jgi:hypothetical protein
LGERHVITPVLAQARLRDAPGDNLPMRKDERRVALSLTFFMVELSEEDKKI